jgi:hypothetical protein
VPFCPTDLCESCGCCLEVSCRKGCHIEGHCGLCDDDFVEGDEQITLLDGDEYPFRAHKSCAS